MYNLMYLEEKLETFNSEMEAIYYIELLCMSGEGYNHKNFSVMKVKQ